MAVDDFLVTDELCGQHKDWRNNNSGYPDNLTAFCNDFAKYKKQPNRYKHHTPANIVSGALNTNNKAVVTTTRGERRINGYLNGQRIDLTLNGFCDITNYLKYIQTRTERLTCYFGLDTFLSFGGVVRIGNKDYTYLDKDYLMDDIYDQTAHIL